MRAHDAGGNLLDEGGEDLVLHAQEQLQLLLQHRRDARSKRQRRRTDDAIAATLLEGERSQRVALQEVERLEMTATTRHSRGL